MSHHWADDYASLLGKYAVLGAEIERLAKFSTDVSDDNRRLRGALAETRRWLQTLSTPDDKIIQAVLAMADDALEVRK